jgi:hypothetical protein
MPRTMLAACEDEVLGDMNGPLLYWGPVARPAPAPVCVCGACRPAAKAA